MTTERPIDDDTLAAWALDALDDTETRAVDASIASDQSVARRAGALLEVAARLNADITPADAPDANELRARALANRHAGASLLSPAQPASLPEVHRQVAADAESFVASLTDDELDRPTRFDAPVRDLLAHIIGQLDKTATELGDGAFPPFADGEYEHWLATRSYRDRHATANGPTLARALADVNRRIAARLAVLDGTDDFGDPRAIGSQASRTLAKFFEEWMHVDDVRLALGRPTTTPDASAMLTICTLAADILPYGMGESGNARSGRTLRLVLTGPGGGTWLCPLAPGESASPTADIALIADGATFCRLFHRQVEPAAALRAIEGDRELADAILAGAQAFAENT